MIDTKGELNWPGFYITRDYREAFAVARTGKQNAIFRPDGNLFHVEQLFARAYKEEGWTVYVDEAYMIGFGSVQRFPPSFTRCLTAGRSRHVTVFVGTQRPRFIPLFCYSEPKHVFVFRLSSKYDRVHVAKSVGEERLAKKMVGHNFLYYNDIQETVVQSVLKLAA